MESIFNYFKQGVEIFNYEVFYEIDNEKIIYKHIYVEDKEALGNYCIVFGEDRFYYLGEIIKDKKVTCWAKFNKLNEAVKAL